MADVTHEELLRCRELLDAGVVKPKPGTSSITFLTYDAVEKYCKCFGCDPKKIPYVEDIDCWVLRT